MGSKLGVLKVAASRLGVTFEEYQSKLKDGLKWCFSCGQWKPRVFFGLNCLKGDGLSPQCFSCVRVRTKKKRKISGPSPRLQNKISYVIRVAIQRGLLARPTILPCIGCGKPAVEYHHHLGYGRSHWLDVQALCKKCHVNAHW